MVRLLNHYQGTFHSLKGGCDWSILFARLNPTKSLYALSNCCWKVPGPKYSNSWHSICLISFSTTNVLWQTASIYDILLMKINWSYNWFINTILSFHSLMNCAELTSQSWQDLLGFDTHWWKLCTLAIVGAGCNKESKLHRSRASKDPDSRRAWCTIWCMWRRTFSAGWEGLTSGFNPVRIEDGVVWGAMQTDLIDLAIYP